jgi:hypothetical protein
MWHEIAESGGVPRGYFQTVNDEISKTSRICALRRHRAESIHRLASFYLKTAMLFRFKCLTQAREMDAA